MLLTYKRPRWRETVKCRGVLDKPEIEHAHRGRFQRPGPGACAAPAADSVRIERLTRKRSLCRCVDPYVDLRGDAALRASDVTWIA